MTERGRLIAKATAGLRDCGEVRFRRGDEDIECQICHLMVNRRGIKAHETACAKRSRLPLTTTGFSRIPPTKAAGR